MTDAQQDAAEALLVEAVMKLVKEGYTEGNIQRIVGDGSFLHSYAQTHIDAGIQPTPKSIRHLNDTMDATTEYKTGDYAILRGAEVLLHGIEDYEQAVRLAEELAHTNHLPMIVVKVLAVEEGRLQ